MFLCCAVSQMLFVRDSSDDGIALQIFKSFVSTSQQRPICRGDSLLLARSYSHLCYITQSITQMLVINTVLTHKGKLQYILQLSFFHLHTEGAVSQTQLKNHLCTFQQALCKVPVPPHRTRPVCKESISCPNIFIPAKTFSFPRLCALYFKHFSMFLDIVSHHEGF